VIVLAFLVLNYLQIKLLDPIRTERFEAMKLILLENPGDQPVIQKARELDMELRQEKFTRLEFSRIGSRILLFWVALFIASLKFAGSLKKKMPAPGAEGDTRSEQLMAAAIGRWSVTVVLLILGIGSVTLSLQRGGYIGAGGIAGPVYPTAEEMAANWHRFRGPAGAGISNHANIPTEWDGESGEGILWKVKTPLPGHNSPVIWGDKVFICGANEEKREVYCFDAKSGELLWTGDVKTVSRGEEEPEMWDDTGYAAPTAVTDGEKVYAIFSNGDVGCFDFEGNQVWVRNLGVPDSVYGYSSSLEIYKNNILVQYDQGSARQAKSKVIALDSFFGRTVWERSRDVANSWTSPIVVETKEDGWNLITASDEWVIAYDVNDGNELWRVDCLGADVAPSPIYAGGYIMAIEPYNQLVAIKCGGRGDVTKTHIAWIGEDNIPDICSPVSDGERIYLLASEGVLTCYRIADGKLLWEEEVDDMFQGSPSIAGGKLYMVSEEGVTYIAEVGEEYKEIGRNELGEGVVSSPAFMDGRIYIRGKENLYCIGQEQ
jgi:outer membrane protein assembly factor BamB